MSERTVPVRNVFGAEAETLDYNPTMAYERQKAIERELDARIPRGPRGSPQNELRLRFNIYRMEGLPSEASLALAVGGVREREPDFAPRVLPPSQA